MPLQHISGRQGCIGAAFQDAATLVSLKSLSHLLLKPCRLRHGGIHQPWSLFSNLLTLAPQEGCHDLRKLLAYLRNPSYPAKPIDPGGHCMRKGLAQAQDVTTFCRVHAWTDSDWDHAGLKILLRLAKAIISALQLHARKR